MYKYKDLITSIINEGPIDAKTLLMAKRKWSKNKTPTMPKNSAIYADYLKLIKINPKLKNKQFENLLNIKKVRTISGVAPVAVLTKAYPCPGNCIYCPTQAKVPKSYLDDEPAVMRAIDANYDPYIQVQRRLKQYLDIGHNPEKVELIVIGGSFSVLPEKYKYWFIRRCFDACNEFGKNKKAKSKKTALVNEKNTLKLAQTTNQTARFRIIGITLETRPDLITGNEIKTMRELGCTRVEMGVQTVYEDVFELIKRGHGLNAVVMATKLLKDHGFKICYHLMPNLPGSDLKKDYDMFKTVYTDSRFKPDMVKIYPCVVTRNTKLYEWLKQGKYFSYTDTKLINLLFRVKSIIPRWIRINRLYRDIPKRNIMSGSKISNIRQLVQKQIQAKGKKCYCIRCREIKQNVISAMLEQKISKYQASGGAEYFLEYIDKSDQLYALLRLRLIKNSNPAYQVLNNSAIIRDVHTYGRALKIKSKDKSKVQHQGLGKKLINAAEQIAIKQGYKKMAVISGVGTREYYRKLGYRLKDTYMVKNL